MYSSLTTFIVYLISVFELNLSSLCIEVHDKFRKCKSEERTDVNEKYRELFHPHVNKTENVQVNKRRVPKKKVNFGHISTVGV